MAAESAPSKPLSVAWAQVRAFFASLAGRLLVLSTVLVVFTELLIFGPGLASFHENWLRERINLAQIAALALEVSPDTDIADSLEYELLTNAEVQRVAMQRAGERELLLGDPTAPVGGPLTTYDYSDASGWRRYWWAIETFTAREGRVLRVIAKPRFESGEFIEIVLNEAPLKRDMRAFAERFALISSLILIAAAGLVYGALTFLFVRPMREFTAEIERFRDQPEDVTIFVRSRRTDEIGRAERAAHDMAEQVRASLRQRERLAALGAAVAKIGHDLRNMLATAQLVADRLAKSEDPTVRQIAPRLERTIDRAAALAASTLKYGRAEESPPQLQRVELASAAAEAALDALTGLEDVGYKDEIEAGLVVRADPDHLHRILVNLIRNAAQIMQANPTPRGKVVTVRAVGFPERCEIDVIDRGPGVRPQLLDRLFDPFVTADAETGGTGLGLAIARELTQAMGGDLILWRTGAEGATFRIILPTA
ncbi:MAG: HAMP domain-containing sensor histidine kinase [Hyphomonadaceae bacterium]|nr:HAMP domain-containing sensor histidine kinase [Hyphomonadaceae bacterium]